MNHSGQAVSIGSAARAVVVFGLVLLPAGLRAADVADARAKLEANYADNLTELAAWCDQHQLKAEAEQTSRWAIKRDPRKLYIFDLPEALEPPAGLDGKPNLTEWWNRWTKLRREQADALFEFELPPLSEAALPFLQMSIGRLFSPQGWTMVRWSRELYRRRFSRFRRRRHSCACASGSSG